MATLNTAILIKDVTAGKTIGTLNKVKNWLGWIVLLFFPLILIVGNKNSIYIVYALLVYLVLYGIFCLFISIIVKATRNTQSIDTSFERDRLIIELGKKYDKLRRRNLISNIIFICIAVFSFIGAVAIGLSVDGGAGEQMPTASYPLIVIAVIAIFLPILISLFSQMFFASRELKTIEQLNKLMLECRGMNKEQIAKQNHSILGTAYDQQKKLSYLYPHEDLRKKAIHAGRFLVISAMVLGILIGLLTVYIFMLQIERVNNNAYLLGTIGYSVIFILFATVILVNQLFTKKILKQQRERMEQDPEKYKHHLELADEMKKYSKKSNSILLVYVVIIAAICIVATILVPISLKPISLILSFLVFYFGDLIIIAATYPSYRRKSRLIEIKIDEQILDQSELTVTPQQPAEDVKSLQSLDSQPFAENANITQQLETKPTDNKGEKYEQN